MITAIINVGDTFSQRRFYTRSVLEVQRKLMKEYGGIRKTYIDGDGVVVWCFSKGAYVSLAGNLKIKAGYRSLK
jgi:hypothetical protein